MRYQNPQSGFTLLEVLLYSLIASTLLAGVTVFVSMTLEGNARQRVITDVESEAAAAIERITQVIRNAEGITTPVIGATGTTLVLDVVDNALDPTTIDVSSGALRIDEGSGSPEALTSNRVIASNLVVSNLTRGASPGTVHITFTLEASALTGRSTLNYSQTFYASASLRYD